MLTNTNLPTEEQEFFELLKLYFCNIYDVKYLMKSCKNLKGGLQEVSEQLEVGVICAAKEITVVINSSSFWDIWMIIPSL